ncbi:hypothetical protein (mitochondrion) [Candida oxycetoniae]|uniref:Uncharacterized protein n=1 Tax=Candida oxycetoniae TaxID=497107 RepID=S5TNJ1_9ASCO|nr:hypothetical protein [Candida oxycetoniae]AGS44325.1 hypothetical protein [Candida oxycetoniae]
MKSNWLPLSLSLNILVFSLLRVKPLSANKLSNYIWFNIVHHYMFWSCYNNKIIVISNICKCWAYTCTWTIFKFNCNFLLFVKGNNASIITFSNPLKVKLANKTPLEIHAFTNINNFECINKLSINHVWLRLSKKPLISVSNIHLFSGSSRDKLFIRLLLEVFFNIFVSSIVLRWVLR